MAIVLDMGDRWQSPWLTGVFALATALSAVTGMTRFTFVTLLAAATGYYLLFRFPDVANHVNVIICLNVALILAITYSFVRHPDTGPDDDFDAVAPLLRIALMMVYFVAGFDKLNRDYLDPEVSCGAWMFDGIIAALRTSVLGVPAVGIVAAVGLIAGYRLTRRSRFGGPGSRAFNTRVLVIGVVVLGAAVAVPLTARLAVPEALLSTIGMVAALAVLGWELIGSLLLAVPRLQAPILAFSLTMHATLALVGFADFGALALALLFCFVPVDYQRALITQGDVRVGGFVVHRIHFYVAIGVAVTVVTGMLVHHIPDSYVIAGLLFNLAVLIVVWPILAIACSPSPRPAWRGVHILDRRMPAFLYLFPVALVFLGMTPYLGLRTAGNFSMFSNLRTEGETSNHLLLGGNPLKIWSYQEDVVWIVDIDDRYGAPIHHYDESPRGDALPVVEFRKWIYQWTRAGYQVPLTFRHRGRLYSTKDIVTDPQWRAASRTPEMVLLDFRIIQAGDPNQCRW